MPDSSPWTRLAAVAIYAAAMAVVEAMVVYYLRRLFALQYAAVFTPGRFSFPHAYLRHEQIREAATIVMLLAVAWLAGRGLVQKLAYFLFAFGVWDIGYYVALKIMLDWPASLGTRDLLFLSPRAVVGAGVGAAARLGGVHRRGVAPAAACAAALSDMAERRSAAATSPIVTAATRAAAAGTWSPARRDLQHPQRDRPGRTRFVALSAAGGGRRRRRPRLPISPASRRSTAFSRGICCDACRATPRPAPDAPTAVAAASAAPCSTVRARLALDDSTTRWFSDTPDVAGSTGWGNRLPRIVTLARFTDRRSGRRFGLANCHLEGRPAGGAPSQRRGARDLARARTCPGSCSATSTPSPDDAAIHTLLAAGLRDVFAAGPGDVRGPAGSAAP